MGSKALRQGRRVQWSDLCNDESFRGRWVALDGVRYDGNTPLDGELVDSDQDLAALCARIQAGSSNSCAILLCEPRASGIRRVKTNPGDD